MVSEHVWIINAPDCACNPKRSPLSFLQCPRVKTVVQSTPTMQLLQFNFFMFTLNGFWVPSDTTAKWKLFLYKFYTISTSLMITSILMRKIYTVIIDDCTSFDQFIDSTFLLPDYIVAFFKCLQVKCKQNDLMTIERILRFNRYAARDKTELMIYNKFHKMGR